jgi:hypothetical protein
MCVSSLPAEFGNADSLQSAWDAPRFEEAPAEAEERLIPTIS